MTDDKRLESCLPASEHKPLLGSEPREGIDAIGRSRPLTGNLRDAMSMVERGEARSIAQALRIEAAFK